MDEIQGELLLKVRQKMESLEETSGISRERFKGHLDFNLLKELEEKRAGMMRELSGELQKRKEGMAGKFGHNMGRFVKSYPNLNRGYRIRRESRFQKKHEKD